jgi:hypothetical protein
MSDDRALLEAAWDELHAATDELHAATPPGWFVGRPGQRHGGQWAMYAFDQTEKAHIGRRSREWTAAGETEVECVRGMARCLKEIGEERVPK